MSRSSVVIVSPALADANNGNWQTARRWQRLLAPSHAVRIVREWPDALAAGDQAMLALHARRSAPAVAAWAHQRGGMQLAVVLTGTDLYQDIHTDASAQRSLQLASQLVVLQALGLQTVPLALRVKTRVIHQSSPARQTLASKPTRWLRALMVGHLRAVKSPQTFFEAAHLLTGRPDIRLDHIGDASEAPWAARARSTELACPSYRWLGALPHEATRRAIQRAHVLVHASAMEGGAHVIMEALRSGTPVLASRVDGNVGMLGEDYAGYFAHGDAPALAELLRRLRAEQSALSGNSEPQTVQDPLYTLTMQLRTQCEARSMLFSAEAERAALLQLTADLLNSKRIL